MSPHSPRSLHPDHSSSQLNKPQPTHTHKSKNKLLSMCVLLYLHITNSVCTWWTDLASQALVCHWSTNAAVRILWYLILARNPLTYRGTQQGKVDRLASCIHYYEQKACTQRGCVCKKALILSVLFLPTIFCILVTVAPSMSDFICFSCCSPLSFRNACSSRSHNTHALMKT